jgi:endonuclease/exonuclease/phosphatase family metal-dependent hydrolase
MKRSAPLWFAFAAVLLACLAFLAFRGRPSGPGPGDPTAPAARNPSASAAPGTIRIGSYNMAMFGLSKEKRPATMEILARIGSSFDLLAMQEVGSNGSSASEETCAEVMDAYLALVNESSGGDKYAYVRGDQYAFLYRKDRLELKSSGPYSGKEAFTYRPLVAYFQVRGRPLDFAVITVHTRPSLAKREIPELAAAMDEVSASLAEPDVLCLGDFNADGSYYAEAGSTLTAASAVSAADAGSTSTSSSGNTSTWLAGFSPDRYETLIPNDADTTVAAGSDCAYDRMEISSAMKGDYDGKWGILRPGELWDLSACEGSKESAGGERALSDHYPVWAEFSTTKDSD